MTKNEFAEAMAVITITLDKPMPRERMAAYFQLLQDIPAEDFRQGVQRLLNERVYSNVPSPAELRQAAQGGRRNIDAQARGLRAWQAVTEAFRFGSYRTVTFTDPLVNAAVRAVGGWVELCECDNREIAFRERRFLQHYSSLMATGTHAEQCRPLQGIIAQQNGRDGYQDRLPEPEVIDCGLPTLPPGLIRGKIGQPEQRQRITNGAEAISHVAEALAAPSARSDSAT